MLIRVSGRSSGVKDYLENGHKEGREYTRDELDEREILDGDLGLTDEIINHMENEGERYLSITLAFKEDEVSIDTLREITAELKSFAMTAYAADEFNFYAEAHLPKIKSYTHQRTGEFVERKPHIHVVIPQLNLLTGQRLNPLGRVEQQIKFLDAFQEYINHKHGLASPKDHRRTEFTSASEMISRYKGDIFERGHRELKDLLLSEVLNKKITRYEDFKKLLAEHGATRERNAGASNEYLNVKPADQAKGVNLKEFVFSRDFIELSDAAKRTRLAQEIKHHYDTAKDPRSTPGEIGKLLDEWHNVRSKEIKHLNSGNKKFYAHYKSSTPEQRREILKDREQRFNVKHRKEVDHVRNHRKPHINEVGKEPPPFARNRLRRLSELDVVRHAERGEVLLSSDVPGELANRRQGEGRDLDLRRSGNRAGGRIKDNVTSQLLGAVAEKRNQSAGASAEWTEIRDKLDARRLLAHVSKTHGVIPEKYEITTAKDGTDRIKCGTRNLNTSDFLTKELNLAWKDAAPILRQSYAEQLGREPKRERHTPKRGLWTEYRNEWKPQQQKNKSSDWDAQRVTEKARRAAIKAKFDRVKSSLTGTRAEQKAARSVARMQKVFREAQLRETAKAERQALKEKYQKPAAELYRDFLAEKVENGNEEALIELRRQRSTENTVEDDSPNRFGSPQQAAKQQAAPILSMNYRVSRNGDVTYQDDRGRDAIKDVGHEVRLLAVDDKNIETGLRFSMQKFGKNIALTGDESFKRRTVEIAVSRGIDVEFSDPAAKRYHATLKHQKEIDRQHRELGTEFFKQQKAAQTTKPVQQIRDLEPERKTPEREPKIRDKDIDHDR